MNNNTCTEVHHLPHSSSESMPRLQKIDSVSSISSMESHSSLSSQSNAPSLTHTTTTTCSKYSSVTEQDHDVINYKHAYSDGPAMVDSSNRCSTYRSGFTNTRVSKNPSQDMNMNITSNKSRPVTYQKKLSWITPMHTVAQQQCRVHIHAFRTEKVCGMVYSNVSVVSFLLSTITMSSCSKPRTTESKIYTRLKEIRT